MAPEFIAYAIQDWLREAEVNKLRDECLNRELFGRLLEARIILEGWRNEYNDQRPHSSLGYQTPAEYARRASDIGLQSAYGLLAPNIAKNITPISNQPAELQL